MDVSTIFQNLQDLRERLLAPEAFWQIGVFIGIIILAYIPHRLLNWFLTKLQTRLEQLSFLQNQKWLGTIFAFVKITFYPLFVWALGQLAVTTAQSLGWENGILAWLLPFSLIWLINRLAALFVKFAFSEEQGQTFQRRVIPPATLTLTAVYVGGFIDNVLQFRWEILQGVIFGVIFFIAKAPIESLQSQLGKLQERVAGLAVVDIVPILRDILVVFQKALHPFLAWLFTLIAASLVDTAGLDNSLLNWAAPFYLLWFAHVVIRTFLWLHFSSERVERWERILKVVIWGIAILHSINRLAFIWNWVLVDLEDNARLQLGGLITGLIIAYISFALSRTTRGYLQEKLPQTGMTYSLSQIIATLAGYAIAIVGLLFALNRMNIPLTTLTIVVGGLSVGLGFGMQEIISNFFSGFIIMFDRSVHPGDIIEIADRIGVVQEIGLRSTRLKTIQNVDLVVPNSSLLTDIVINYSRAGDELVRVDIEVYAPYCCNPCEVRQAIMEAAAKTPGVLTNPVPYVAFTAFDNNGVNHFALETWIADPKERNNIMSETRYNIWAELDARGLNFPVPPWEAD